MQGLKSTIFTLFLGLIPFLLAAQTTPPLATQSINEGSIQDQFEFVIKKSTNWNDDKGQSYEVIKRTMMQTLKAHTNDTLQAIQNKLSTTRGVVQQQQEEISNLQATLTSTKDQLAATNQEKDSMSLLGIQLSKTGYNLFMWSLVAGLVALLAFFIFRFQNSNLVTKATKAALADMEEEFKTHRKVALEREQKVKRELQDMINKYEG